MAGAAFGGMLGAAQGDLSEALQGAVIGGVLSAIAARFLKTKEQQKVAFPTDREADFYLNTTPLIQEYIQDKVERGLKVEGRLHFLPNEQFEPLCFDYLLDRLEEGASLPKGKKPTRASGNVSVAREIASRSPGFQSNFQIYINQEKAEDGTVIHESVHLFQEISYAKRVGPDSNEGTTEYFTRLICAKHQIMRSQKYPIQYECIKKLVSVCGEDKLAEAYFQGNISALESAVDAKNHKGTFQMWINFMKRRDFKRANNLL